MKKYIILCAALCSLCLCAGTIQEKFLQANAAYHEGKFAQALALYDSIQPKGTAVNYNIGNCYFRLGDYAHAVLFWMRAQKNASWRDFSVLDKEIGRAYALLSIPRERSLFAKTVLFVMRISSLCSLLVWQLLFLICWIALCWYVPLLYKNKRYILLGLWLIVAVSLGVLLYAKHYSQRPYALVTKDSISVHAGPGLDFASVTEAKILDTVHIVEQRDGWYKVYIRRCGYGWVDGTELSVI
jgi:tetratricopeptide (TPR) repeat protein